MISSSLDEVVINIKNKLFPSPTFVTISSTPQVVEQSHIIDMVVFLQLFSPLIWSTSLEEPLSRTGGSGILGELFIFLFEHNTIKIAPWGICLLYVQCVSTTFLNNFDRRISSLYIFPRFFQKSVCLWIWGCQASIRHGQGSAALAPWRTLPRLCEFKQNVKSKKDTSSKLCVFCLLF